VAVTNTILPLGSAHLLALFTFLWVAGFDVIYATLDEESDRREGVHSLSVALGRRGALRVAAGLHLAAWIALAWLTFRHLPGPPARVLLAAIAALLFVEHRQAQRVDFAFFRVNAVLGFVVLALVWTGLP
jgi:4-hydroxybenzoate polyprenyltransferase